MTNSEKTRRWLEKNPGYRRQWYRDNAVHVCYAARKFRAASREKLGPNKELRT